MRVTQPLQKEKEKRENSQSPVYCKSEIRSNPRVLHRLMTTIIVVITSYANRRLCYRCVLARFPIQKRPRVARVTTIGGEIDDIITSGSPISECISRRIPIVVRLGTDARLLDKSLVRRLFVLFFFFFMTISRCRKNKIIIILKSSSLGVTTSRRGKSKPRPRGARSCVVFTRAPQ